VGLLAPLDRRDRAALVQQDLRVPAEQPRPLRRGRGALDVLQRPEGLAQPPQRLRVAADPKRDDGLLLDQAGLLDRASRERLA
jgi:hypothetical protein